MPATANVTARRRTTALFGLGLVDATPDQTFIDVAASQPVGIRGHVNLVFNISQFSQIGCDGCHVRTLTSGPSSIAALSNQVYRPFSDFLLHDMGTLADNIGDNGTAGVTEMRTAPLWGLRLLDDHHQLLHDGRATSLSDAIVRHDGQASAARNAFNALGSTDKNNLIAFLKTL